MRVIAGKFRSRKLKGPGSLRLRPTSDRLRETVFNILGPKIEDSLFVDVYAGTGAIGIEAFSRGAREVVWIESDPNAARLIEQNLLSLAIQQGVELIRADALEGLKRLAARHALADFIFVDPPYEKKEEHERILDYLDTAHLVAPRGCVLVEHFWKSALPERFDRLERFRLIEQGDASISLYRLAAAA
jgi:16S rRNA (guanine(966)-N(2))-methyltransferase RsmD